MWPKTKFRLLGSTRTKLIKISLLGLFLGASILSFVEVFDLIFYLILILLKHSYYRMIERKRNSMIAIDGIQINYSVWSILRRHMWQKNRLEVK